MEAPHYPAQCLVGKFIRMFTILAVEICHKPPAHFQVTRSLGITTFIEPMQELLEPVSAWRPGTNLQKPWNT